MASMAHSISTAFSALDLDTDATSVSSLNSADLQATIQRIIDRCSILHTEVEIYVAAVNAKSKAGRRQTTVEYHKLRNDMKNELAFLRKMRGTDFTEEKTRHYIVSSNLLYYEALWSAAKRCVGLRGFRKYYYWDRHKAPPGKNTPQSCSPAKGNQNKSKAAALVDIVANEGTQWVRISTLSPKRLLFDLAKMGWMNDSDSDDGMPTSSPADDDDDEGQVTVVRNARELARAAKANPVRGRSPQVYFVLTRIVSGQSKEMDMIINKIRATGAIVQCANDIPPSVPLQSVLPQLLIDHSRTMSDTLNIDCTILLALISDISHRECSILDWYPGEVRAQIKEEAEERLLPTHLYPAISAHAMVCTKEAAEQMNLIVETLATDAERLRADILLGQRSREGYSPEDLIAEWSSASDHNVPEGFKLPIRVMSSNIASFTRRLPAVATKVATELGPLNGSIFLYGWVEGLTTLSANRSRARQIDAIINENGLQDGETGPHIWLCGESRSLIAKHGRRS